ncbi:hypothetical protein SLEP1_g8660 [Rubroshorea leprosula]|nr:hypothetical protein SLEP1_g8660 [Rubroshorea leprosula]
MVANASKIRRDKRIVNAVKDVEKQLQAQRSWASDENHARCDGRMKGRENRFPSLGKDGITLTKSPVFPGAHARVLKHPCRDYDENEAKLFYVPFYAGLHILRWHFKNVSNDVKDALSLELMKWLENKRPWLRKPGEDHVFVLGKISWDFRRRDDSPWGSRFLRLDQLQNPIKL